MGAAVELNATRGAPHGASEVPWWRTSFGQEEIQRLQEAIRAEHISQGPVTAQFETRMAEALHVPYAVATTSGSVALLMALMALGVGRDDEVILPNRTFIATAHAVLLAGASVVLVDVRPDIPVMDISRLRQKITPRTKAIIPVHLNGRAVDLEAVQSVAREYHLHVIEDACQALFSRSAAGFLGTQSDAGCFSLGMNKLMSTGQGGLIVTRNPETYERLKLIRSHGVTDTFVATYRQIGCNFKFTDLMASVGLVQLTRVPARIAHVTAIYSKYTAAEMPFLRWIPVEVSKGELPLYAEARCRDRKDLVEFLGSQGIQTRPFLPDLHLSPHLHNGGVFPNSKPFGEEGLYLPCGPEQPLENIDRVIEALRLYGRRSCGSSSWGRQNSPSAVPVPL
ncbi:MAG: DegT/DnrJ/EryC1/StrS family aminotransferase [Candidatus Omnitrophica bacterium]|nr:DegT/DnrJ/EryC1/StrS family aminotransferase [Candidatus Omnitrophota bacterium]